MMHFLLICISLSLVSPGYARTWLVNIHNRILKFNCPESMIPDIRNGENSRECKCPIGYLYLRSNEACHLPFRQGPCPPGHYVNLAINETLPKCIVNPCSKNGLVPYNGTCHIIGIWREGPCDVGGLVTDPETFQPKCIDEVANPLWIIKQLRCPDYGLLNTSDSQDPSTWKCECRELGHVYVSLKNACYKPYRQGPCQPGSYLFPAANGTESQCVVNPCSEDGLVPYNGSCYKLGAWGVGPCGIGALVVDLSTFQLKCYDEIINPASVLSQINCPKDTYFDNLLRDSKFWKCRCQHEDFVHVPFYQSCHRVNRQGPCPFGQYVHLAINETLADCIVNPCLEDGLVPYNGSCYKLGVWGEGPCNVGGLVIDPETFQPKCIEEIPKPMWISDQLECSGGRILNTFYMHDVSIWKCECALPGHLYFPLKNGCYRPYRQGPCASKHYVYLASNEIVPQCIVNPCSEDGLVPYNGTCQKFAVWGEGPCTVGGLIADPTTFQLKCIADIDDPSSVAKLMECPYNLILRNTWSNDPGRWTCECPMNNQLYFPIYNSCYEVYKQGPCLSGQYVYRAINATVPECAVNPCSKDGLVLYNGTCHDLRGDKGPCGAYSHFTVETKTYQVVCSEPYLILKLVLDAPKKHCASGSQRDQYGKCRELIR